MLQTKHLTVIQDQLKKYIPVTFYLSSPICTAKMAHNISAAVP